MYHHILPKSGFITVSEDNFKDQMQMLKKEGWHTLSAEEFLDFKLGKLTPPKKSLLLTFDDGWLDNYTYAYPVLKELGFRATVFIVTEWIENAPHSKELVYSTHKEAGILAQKGKKGAVFSKELMHESNDVFDFHSHLHTHTNRFKEEVNFTLELQKSQEFFKKEFGEPSRHLCHPWGHYKKDDEKAILEAGFTLAYTVENGSNTQNDNPLYIKRFNVKDRGANWLKNKLQLYSNAYLAKLYGSYKKLKNSI
jgi:peptidoglycan/xylan/chitin deacetylase (PgdA/CDA1 family)